MKRLFVSILAILYLATASGATVHLHICMGHLTGISLFGDKDDHCDHCGMKKKRGNNCCKSELKVIKAATAHIPVAGFVFSSPVHAAAIPFHPTYSNHLTYYIQPTHSCRYGYSPPYRCCPIYIAQRNIRV